MPYVLDGRLSPGQLVALTLAANGLTASQIGTRLDTTETGIHLRLNAAARSLGAKSRAHAVAIAIARGLIQTTDIHLPDQKERAA